MAGVVVVAVELVALGEVDRGSRDQAPEVARENVSHEGVAWHPRAIGRWNGANRLFDY